MKLTSIQIDRLVRRVFDELKTQNIIEFKADEGKVAKRAADIVKADYQREADLEKEVSAMLEKLEKQNPGEFERYKMYPMLKKRLAKEKGIIL